MRDIITEIWSTAKRNKLRTALTGFAVAWGIFMLIFLLGSGNGLINALEQNAGSVLDNSMVVYSGQTSIPYNGLQEGRYIELEDQDFNTTNQKFNHIIDKAGATIWQGTANVALGENYFSSSMEGVYPNMAEIDKMDMLHGRFINQVDINENRKVLVLSETNAKELEPHDCGRLIGQQVKVDNIAFQVVGIYDNDESEMNDVVYTPFTTLRILYNKGDRADRFMFSFHGLESEEENEAFEDAYRRTINANHQAAPEDEETIWIWNRFLNNMQMNQGMSIIRTALWIIGIFTLLSGIVGVSNIMLISVKERTREFGIRKAIGAKPLSILKLIIVESVIITTFFGYIGMVIGIAANQYMDATIGHEQTDTGLFKTTLFVNPTVGLDVCVEATLVMIIAGTLAGLIPARKAAHIRPIEALRAE
ncbi:MAG TPA: ABC transporter permease [Candidatus Prevotella avicola]|uniref:ABC transporter permease n=1 Tax=Candidatus Prevotella avicola TaxID=2838738 RepID=A0A9D2JXD7_9BACT|nr:aBC superfamily ATP binding cassette transporter permease protein [Prevotella sp. CAG:1320]HIZ69429.1 ABC transporter permease [Candidatus Prevotella avicola]